MKYNRKQTAVLVGIFLVALSVRLAFLGRENLWFDETFTWYAARMPVSKIWFDLWHSARYPPLYYVLVHYILVFGESEFVLRLPSAVFGALSVPLLFVWGNRITSTKTAWLATALLAFSPLTIWYSQEARMYILVMFFALWAGYSFTGILRSEGWSHWVGFIVATASGLYIHYVTFALLAIFNIMAVAWWLAKPPSLPRFSIYKWILAQFVLLILYIPWLPKIPRHWQLTRNETTYPLWILTSPAMLVAFAIGGLVFLAILVWLIRNFNLLKIKEHPKLMTIGVLLVLIIYVGLNALVVINRAATLTRQTLLFVPYLYLGLAILLAAIPNWHRWVAGILTVTIVFAVLNVYLIQKPRWRDATRWIALNSNAGDALVISSPWFITVLDYYSPGDIPVIAVRPSDARKSVPDLAAKYKNVWLLLNVKEERWVDPLQNVRTQFNQTYQLEHEYKFGLLDLQRFNLQTHP